MKSMPYMKTVFLFIVVAALVGCGPKKEKAAETPAPAQEKGATAADPKDKADASAAGARFYAQMQAGDFPAIYRESSAAFKKTGSESKFVSFMKGLQQKTGALKTTKEIDFQSAPNKELGNIYSVTFALQFEKEKQTQIVTFARSSNGKMELAGLQQVKE